MPTDHLIKLSVKLVPRWHRNPPEVLIGAQNLSRITLRETQIFDFEWRGQGRQTLTLTLLNKTEKDSDHLHGRDMAVIIDDISFFGISDPRFIWAGRFYPTYPENWAREQQSQGVELPAELENIQYLGWNGTWRLEFWSPVFTWIHQKQHLGWIYD